MARARRVESGSRAPSLDGPFQSPIDGHAGRPREAYLFSSFFFSFPFFLPTAVSCRQASGGPVAFVALLLSPAIRCRSRRI